MLKIIKRYGNANVIRLTPDEMKINGWRIGDVLDISDIVKVKGVKNNGNKK